MKRYVRYWPAFLILLSLTFSQDALPFTWTPRADTLQPRGLHGGGTINDLIYLAGGGFTSLAVCDSLRTAEVYDLAGDSWSPIADMNEVRTAPSSVVATFGGEPRLYVIGGMDITGFDCLEFYSRPSIDEYDPLSNTWRLVGNCSSPPDDCLEDPDHTWGTCAVTVDNKIYIMGGASSTLSSLTARMASYDPDTDTYVRLADLPMGVSDGSCAAVGRKIYWFSGYEHTRGWGDLPISSIFIYDIDMDTWETASSNTPTARANAAAIAIDGIIYVMGGWDGTATYSGFFNSIDAYDPALDSWTPDVSDPLGCVPDSPSEGFRGRVGFTLHLVNDGVEDRLYASGGNVGITASTKCNESTGLTTVVDQDPPEFTGLTAAHELTDCPDPAIPMVRLEWEPGTDMTPPVTYNVYRGDSPTFPADSGSRIASNITDLEYVDSLTDTDCGLTYYYLVRAQDSAVPPNEDSNEVRLAVDLTCPPPPVPSSVGNRLLVYKEATEDPVLNWSGYVPSPDVTHYHVYRSPSKDGLGSIVYEPAVTLQTDSSATGDSYFYEVRSANDCRDGESED